MFESNNPQGLGLMTSGAPTAGTTCVQTITIGGTPTGGSFQLRFGDLTTSSIAWSATDDTLVANIKAALEALSTIGTSNTSVAAGTGSSGIGTYLVTFAGSLAKSAVGALSIAHNNLSGTAPTVAVAVTTTGVTGTVRGAYTGTRVTDYGGPRTYANVGSTTNPQWVRDERKVAVVTLTGTSATTGGAVGSWKPAEGGPVIITKAVVYTTTKSTGAANLSVGTAADATTSSANLLDTLDVGTAVVCADNITDKGTNGRSRQLMSSTQYVTATGSSSTAGLVGTLYVEYLKP